MKTFTLDINTANCKARIFLSFTLQIHFPHHANWDVLVYYFLWRQVQTVFSDDHSIKPEYVRLIWAFAKQHNLLKDSEHVYNLGIPSEHPSTIPGGFQKVINVASRIKIASSTTQLPAKESSENSLPCGIFVRCCLLTVPGRSFNKRPVIMGNESQHEVIFLPKWVIARHHDFFFWLDELSNKIDKIHRVTKF